MDAFDLLDTLDNCARTLQKELDRYEGKNMEPPTYKDYFGEYFDGGECEVCGKELCGCCGDLIDGVCKTCREQMEVYL